VSLCRDAGLTVMPTFVPFTPWTTVQGYADLIDVIEELGLVEQVAPIQLAIRLLITSASPLLELEDVRAVARPFDATSLTWPWAHVDPAVDALQQAVMSLVTAHVQAPRTIAFRAIAKLAREAAGVAPAARPFRPPVPVPAMTEPWYCCAEPMEGF
jgi:hypothetical protein